MPIYTPHPHISCFEKLREFCLLKILMRWLDDSFGCHLLFSIRSFCSEMYILFIHVGCYLRHKYHKNRFLFEVNKCDLYIPAQLVYFPNIGNTYNWLPTRPLNEGSRRFHTRAPWFKAKHIHTINTLCRTGA